MGLIVRTTVQHSGRWPINGRSPTINELLNIADELSKTIERLSREGRPLLDLSQELVLEPAGVLVGGKAEKAAFVLKPYDPEAPKAVK